MNHLFFTDSTYQQTVYLLMLFLVVVGSSLFALQKKFTSFVAGWASVKAWIFAAPILLFFLGLPWPYPLYFLGLTALWGSRVFFQMTGMFHRSNFVWLTYFVVLVSFYFIEIEWLDFYNVMPVMTLLLCCMVPLARNSYKHMVQYIALTLLNYCFIWGFSHLGLIMKTEKGILTALFVIILTEFFDNLYLLISRFSHKIRLVSNITSRRSLEGFFIAGCCTVLLGWGLRHLLPSGKEEYWITISLCCILFGSTGDTILAVIRRDLGIRHINAFILGRGDFYSRLDRFIFVAPTVYYALLLLKRYV